MKIDTDLPVVVLVAVAEACGLSVSWDRAPGADAWTLSAGHGDRRIDHVGTKQSVCAFLTGYAAMQQQTVQILNEFGSAQRELVADMLARVGVK